MKSPQQKLEQIHQFVKRYTADHPMEWDEDLLNNILTEVVTPGPGFYYVFDVGQFQMEFVSDAVFEVLRISPGDFQVHELVTRIHPDDRDYYVNAMQAIAQCFFRKIAPADRPFYKGIIPYRLKVGSEYRLFLQQEVPFVHDHSGILHKNLGWLSDISHIMHRHNRRVSLVGQQGRPSYYGVDMSREPSTHQPEMVQYSERELQVLGLLSRGFTNDNVASCLNISPDTVRTHRKNILAKSNAANSVEAVANAIRNGLI